MQHSICISAALTGAATSWPLQIVAAASVPVSIEEIAVTFDGTSPSAAPVGIALIDQTTNGGTLATTTLPTVLDQHNTETPQTVMGLTWTTTTTSVSLLWHVNVHPQAGIVWKPPVPIVIKGAGKMGLRLLAAASVNAKITVICKE